MTTQPGSQIERTTNPTELPLQEILPYLTAKAEEDSLLGFERGAHNITGRRKVLAPGVSVSTYDEAHKTHMSEMIAGYTDVILDAPVGHVEFIKGEGKASISGAIYIDQSGEAVAMLEVNHDMPSLYNGNAAACWEGAESMGCGALWTRSMFAYLQDPSQTKQDLVAPLDELQKQQLQITLNELSEVTTGDSVL
jgi:hypothetical protein